MKRIADFIVEKRNIIFIITLLLLILSIIGMTKVNVNYDMSSYLPDDSKVKAGMHLMSDEFGDMSTITVMFDNLSPEEQLSKKDELSQIIHVKNVTYDQNDENSQKDNHSKYSLIISADTYSDEARDTLNAIREKYGDSANISGPVVDNDLMITTLMQEIPIIIVIAVFFIFVILFILCDTWVEPFLFMTCIGVAVLLNMGTNAFFDSVSFMTFAIAALLQMGLSMDYSIMLMNRFNQEKAKAKDAAQAMKTALGNSFGAILGSSVTTIVGLLALIFMSFKIGADMGIVLAKGVFISLLCIFTILPGLVVKFDNLMQRTRKKSLNVNTDPIMKFVGKARFIIVPIAVIVVGASIFYKNNLDIIYVKNFDNKQQEYIDSVYGMDNQIIFVYKSDEKKENINSLIEWLEEQKQVNSVTAYTNTIEKQYNYKEIADEIDVEKEKVKLIYQLYRDKDNTAAYEKITLYDLIAFLDNNIISDPAYTELVSQEDKDKILDARKELEDGKIKIADAEKEISNGEKEIKTNEKKIADSEKQLASAKKQLDSAKSEIESNEKKITESEEQIAESEEKLEKSKQEIEKAEKELNSQLESYGKAGATKDDLVQLEETLRSMGLTDDSEYIQLLEKAISAMDQIETGKQQITAGEKQLKTAKKQLEDGKQQLEKGKNDYSAGLKEYEDGKKQLEKGKKELDAGKKELEDGKKELNENKRLYEVPMNAEELSKEMEMSVSEVNDILKIKRIFGIDVEQDTHKVEEVLDFVYDDILTNETFSQSITNDVKNKLDDGKQKIEDSKSLMVSDNYKRMIISLNLPTETDETFEFIKTVYDKIDQTIEGENYLLGDTTMAYEMNEGFVGELNFVTALTIIAILVVVLFTLHSLPSSVMLVAIIQGAVYITTAICVLQGKSVNYVALILVQCILMGATIDYGILFDCNYKEQRKDKNKFEALRIAMKNSIKTILTSSLILFNCCATVGILMTQKIISQTCTIIAYGTVCAALMVIFVLPALTLMLDKIIVRKK